MNRVIVTRAVLGLTAMQVCAIADATNEEILKVANTENPSGTIHGWSQVVREQHEEENLHPVTCQEFPDRKHFIILC